MQSQAADLKSELEAAQQLSLSHQGYAESAQSSDNVGSNSMMICNSSLQMHSLLGSKSCTACMPQSVRYSSCNISSAQHSTACSSSQGGSRHAAQAD